MRGTTLVGLALLFVAAMMFLGSLYVSPAEELALITHRPTAAGMIHGVVFWLSLMLVIVALMFIVHKPKRKTK